MPWRSSKASPLASAHTGCAGWWWKVRKVRARRPPAERRPAVRRTPPPSPAGYDSTHLRAAEQPIRTSMRRRQTA
eukprot:4070242-Prymnesium_polylepis.1